MPSKLKHHVVTLDVLVGGFEKTARHLVSAETTADAYRAALEAECHDLEECNFDSQFGDTVEDVGGMVYIVASCIEVSAEDYAVVKKYL